MALTRPTGDQLRFNSSVNGEIVLDAYLEAAELGGRTLGDLLADIFDSSGEYRSDLFQFREDPSNIGQFQSRVGTFTDPNAGWTTITFTNFATYVANALSYKNDAEAAKTAAETAASTVAPITASLAAVQSVATNIADVQVVAAQATGTITVTPIITATNFVIDSTANKALIFKRDFTFVFDVSDSSHTGHELAFSSTADGTHGGGTEFTANVTRSGTAGTANAKVTILVNDANPAAFFYYNKTTAGYGGNITVRDQNLEALADISGKITTTADTVAPNIVDLVALANAISTLTTVAAQLTPIGNVNTNLTDIQNVANGISNITTLAQTANLNAVSAVSGALTQIGNVNTNLASVNNVSSNTTDISTLANGTNLASIGTVASDIASVNSVAGNLTAVINAAADAILYAVNPQNQQFTDSAGTTAFSALHYANMAAGAGQAFTSMVGDERTVGDSTDIVADAGTDTLSFKGLGGAKIRTDATNDEIYIDSRAVAMAVALG
tara:strand:+ start:8560 stop:10056 length:1497 start_codon:yes stop_codon:yes gene_type:complete